MNSFREDFKSNTDTRLPPIIHPTVQPPPLEKIMVHHNPNLVEMKSNPKGSMKNRKATSFVHVDVSDCYENSQEEITSESKMDLRSLITPESADQNKQLA